MITPQQKAAYEQARVVFATQVSTLQAIAATLQEAVVGPDPNSNLFYATQAIDVAILYIQQRDRFFAKKIMEAAWPN